MKPNENHTVLVVDDDSNVCDMISATLGAEGFETVVASNGREALDYLHGSGGRPGLILLDLMMPEMNGWEFRRLQQEDPLLATIPVAIITGMPDVAGKAEAVGAVDVLTKPSRVEAITALASRFCK